MNGSSSGQLALSVAEEPDSTDQVIEQEGARLFVQDAIAGYLEDMSLDANVVDDQVQFMIAGPDAAG